MSTTVLIIEDSASIRAHIRKVLDRDGEFETVFEASDGLTGFKLMVEKRPDVVLCDLMMPVCDGVKFLALQAARADVRDIPVIMLTGESDSGRKAEILERGAADYCVKPFHEKELLARVRIHARLKRLQDELRAANARLEAQSRTDPLTGLWNRRHLDLVLEGELRRTARYGPPLSVVLVDVDRFKRVNDSYGHPMGDRVLVDLAETFATTVRTTDTLARYGGEEFVVISPDTPAAGAMVLAERLRTTFAATPHRLGDVTIECTASFGIATHDGKTAVTASELLKRADEALYRAKHEGRNRCVAWAAGPVEAQ